MSDCETINSRIYSMLLNACERMQQTAKAMEILDLLVNCTISFSLGKANRDGHNKCRQTFRKEKESND